MLISAIIIDDIINNNIIISYVMVCWIIILDILGKNTLLKLNSCFFLLLWYAYWNI